jgi:hypothetical protein
MKINSPLFFAAFLALTLMNSCATNKQMLADRDAEIQLSREASAGGNFVKMKDGTIKQFHSLKLVTGVFTSPHLLADGKKKIPATEILAYQNGDHYAVSQALISNGRRSFVAVETLPGFAVRVVKGKLNLYCKKFFNGRAAVDEFFLQSGADGQIVAYTPELMKNLIRDNQEAFKYFLTGKENDISKKLQATAELYNNSQLMSKN